MGDECGLGVRFVWFGVFEAHNNCGIFEFCCQGLQFAIVFEKNASSENEIRSPP